MCVCAFCATSAGLEPSAQLAHALHYSEHERVLLLRNVYTFKFNLPIYTVRCTQLIPAAGVNAFWRRRQHAHTHTHTFACSQPSGGPARCNNTSAPICSTHKTLQKASGNVASQLWGFGRVVENRGRQMLSSLVCVVRHSLQLVVSSVSVCVRAFDCPECHLS